MRYLSERLMWLCLWMMLGYVLLAACMGQEPDAAPPWMADKGAPQLLEIRFGYIATAAETPGRGDPGWRAELVRTWYYYGPVTNEHLAQQMERRMAQTDLPRRAGQMRQAAAQLRAGGVREAAEVMAEGHYDGVDWSWGVDDYERDRGEHVLRRKLLYRYPVPGTVPVAYTSVPMLYEIRVLTPHLDVFTEDD